jgi:putative nucleotidyltransferase with HDIG domain
MIPIKNLKGKKVAYIYTVYKCNKIDATLNIRNFTMLSMLLLAFVIVSILFLLEKRQKFLKEQSEILKQQVKERTRTIELALQKERYIKNLLETVFDVSEHLNFSDQKLGLLSECCKRIAHHENYIFAYLNFFDDEQNLKFLSEHYNPAVIQELEKIHNFYKDDKDIMFDLHDGQVVVKNNSKLFSAFSNSMFKEENLKSMIFIPIKDDEQYFGYALIFSSIIHDLEEERIIFSELGKAVSKSLTSLIQKEKNDTLQKQKIKSYKEIIYALVDLTEKRDTYTAGHARRVAEYCIKIAKKLGMSKDELAILEEAAMLHDIGKIITPDSILLKPSSLTNPEFDIIQDHVKAGVSILEGLNLYNNLLEIIKYHHEKYDGSGYPYGLKGDEIPLMSRIMTIADAFDAMTTSRIYKPRKNLDEALDELSRCSGTHFDPELVNIAREVLNDIDLSIQINQLPKSGPEYERLAYHFKDPLTGLYNKDYLLVLLEHGIDGKTFECLNIILLNNFHDYNSKHGWEAGNVFLKKFASFLSDKYSNSYIFRIFGDDFIVLNFKHIDIETSDLIQEEFIKNSSVDVTIEHHDMRNDEQKENIINMLEIHI